MITVDELVQREVAYCVSSLVHTLAGAHECFEPVSGFRMMDGAIAANVKNLSEITEQAFELALPIDDWEEALIQEGYTCSDDGWQHPEHGGFDDPAYVICEFQNIEPHEREVFEHWIVTDWFADKLAEKGEKVDKDFAGLTVWARTTTGQAISMDSVIQDIHAENAARLVSR